MLYVIKLLSSALLIVAITELTKRVGFWGSLLAALPLISIISIGWIYYETRDISKISAFSTQVFWFVIPSLGFFLSLPYLLSHYSFILSLVGAALITVALFLVMIGIFRVVHYSPF